MPVVVRRSALRGDVWTHVLSRVRVGGVGRRFSGRRRVDDDDARRAVSDVFDGVHVESFSESAFNLSTSGAASSWYVENGSYLRL